jgi:hypothetical protein
MLSKALAGILLGAPLCVATLGALIWAWPGTWEHVLIPLTYLFFPLWAGVMAATYLFKSARHAWVWLAAANALAFGLLWLVRDVVGAA